MISAKTVAKLNQELNDLNKLNHKIWERHNDRRKLITLEQKEKEINRLISLLKSSESVN